MEHVINEYLRLERQPENLRECREALERKDTDLLMARCGKRIAFGTAGLRGRMGFGIALMNSVTVLQASQGLCQYCINTFGWEDCQKRGAVIGFDGRYNSRYFAHITAAVFMSKQIPIFLHDRVTATPITPYLVVNKKAICGVQVTASHNPKEDNGYKVYAANGAQIIPPMDSEIDHLIRQQHEQWPGVEEILLHHPHNSLDFASIKVHELLRDPITSSGAWGSYKKCVIEALNLSDLSESKFKVVYTAMHGVGYRWVKDLIVDSLNFPAHQFISVAEQQDPDPEFSTVVFPNPEEKGALDLAKSTAEAVGAQMIIANDPDADRFAAMEQVKGKWRSFTGDEIGALFGAMAFEKALAKGIERSKMLFICSAVSSRFLSYMCSAEGCRFEETLTGFKWMMNRAMEAKSKEGLTPVFCYEEALGYGLVMDIPDKDGVSGAALWLEKAKELYAKGSCMGDWLDELNRRYGYFATENSYYVCSDPNLMKLIFEEFRKGGYRTKIGDYSIARIRDASMNYDSANADDHKCKFDQKAAGNMLTIYFTNGAHITWRGSGTEPKFKYYSEMRSQTSKEEAAIELNKVVKAVCDKLIGSKDLKHA